MIATNRALRLVTLIAPSLVAGWVVLQSTEGEQVLRSAAPVLVALWFAMLGLVALRVRDAARSPEPGAAWDVLDILTGAGRATMWTGAGALLLAMLTGWASLSVLGVLGLGSVYLATAWTALVATGDRPWRRATVTRAILPEVSTEGEPVREELRLAGIRIPAGMRLFATGRPARRGVVTRYAVGTEGSDAEVVLESSLGPVARGEHRAAPIGMWFGDIFGLTRSPVVYRGEACAFTVLPRTTAVDGVRELLGAGGDAATSVQTERMPTEGTFRIREYVPGDDMRRIHWVRSLQANELVVRLPDEIPPADPIVRLVLDNHLWGAEALTCLAPDQLLDALVRVWLGVGKALVAAGTRVTLVTAGARGDGQSVVLMERSMSQRAPREALKLGARAGWQSTFALDSMLQTASVRQVVVSCRPRPIAAHPDLVWVFVPEATWTSPEPWLHVADAIKLPFPSGSADNRLSRRRRERQRVETMWRDRMMFHQMVWWRAPSGAYLAAPVKGRVALQVIP